MPSVPTVLGLPSEDEARSILRNWHRHLSALDVYEIPEGIDRNRWGVLVHDCWWLYETHASRLVRERWGAADLFGVLPNLPGAGGLADRLQCARRVLFDGNRAVWSQLGVRSHICRGACEGHGRGGMVLVWELSR